MGEGSLKCTNRNVALFKPTKGTTCMRSSAVRQEQIEDQKVGCQEVNEGTGAEAGTCREYASAANQRNGMRRQW